MHSSPSDGSLARSSPASRLRLWRIPVAPLLSLIAFSLVTSASSSAAAKRVRRPAVADAGRERAQILASYVRWRGGRAFEAVRSLHSVGTTRTPAGSGTAERWLVRDAAYRSDSVVGAIRSSVRVGPKGAWKLAFSGQIERLSADERSDASREAASLLPIDVSTGQAVRKERLDGFEVSAVEVGDSGDDRSELLIAPNGSLRGLRIRSDGRIRLVRYGDWRRVAGVMMPFREVEEDRDETTSIEFSRIEVNRPMAADTFDRPVSTVSTSFETDRSSEWLAFDFVDGQRIFVRGSINGHPAQMLLDSGAEASVIDRAFLAEVGLRPGVGVAATGLTASAEASAIPDVSIAVGGATLRGVTTASMDLGAVSAQMGHPLTVILGADIFRDAVVDIDFAHRRIAFRDPGRFEPPPGAVGSDLVPAGGQYVVGASVAGRAARLDFDLGSGSPLTLWSGFWTKLDLPPKRSTTIIGGVGGLSEAAITETPEVSFGGTVFTRVPTQLMPPTRSGIARARSDGNLGLPLLKRFRLLVDLPHGKVWFAGPVDTVTPFEKDRSGIAATVADGRMKVLHVSAGSPAEKAGIRVGDVVTVIDGVDAVASPRGWKSGPPGGVHRITLLDGRTVEITLADYY